MISIVTCNNDHRRIGPLRQNIDATIGVEYELIIIDNSSNEFSIFQAYNKGARLANFQNVLFIHDDVKFWTMDFGEILLNLSLPNLGVLGIAGSKVKTCVTSPWWISNHEIVEGNAIYQYNAQHFKNKGPQKINLGFSEENQIEEVVLVDGVFLYTTKEICLNNPFDERYNSFHFYDLDFCLSLYLNGKTNYVSNSILIEHFSPGSLNRDWVISSFLFEKKWSQFNKVISIDSQENMYYEQLAFNSRFRVLLGANYKNKAIVLFLFNLRFFSMTNVKNLLRSFL